MRRNSVESKFDGQGGAIATLRTLCLLRHVALSHTDTIVRGQLTETPHTSDVEISTNFKIPMPVTRHQGDASHDGAPVCLDPAKYANFETAGCSKCRFSGCRACRGYTLREYQAFLHAQEGRPTEVVGQVAGDDVNKDGGGVGLGGQRGIATSTPLGKEGTRQSRVQGGRGWWRCLRW